jgi:hypothetical protein
MQSLRTCTEAMEIHDDTLVWRPSRVSA